jgi:hypothetical protein
MDAEGLVCDLWLKFALLQSSGICVVPDLGYGRGNHIWQYVHVCRSIPHGCEDSPVSGTPVFVPFATPNDGILVQEQ